MTSRFDWRGKNRCGLYIVREVDPYYREHIHDPFKLLQPSLLVSMIQYGQMRGLIGGSTTMVIDADLDPDAPTPSVPGFVRDWTNWPGRVWGVLDVSCVLDGPGSDPKDKVLTRLQTDLKADKGRLLVHLGEGWDNFSRGEFATLQLTKQLLTSNTALIHGLSLLDDEWTAVAAAKANVVWSPSSNVRLYGRTIDIGSVIGRGIPVALAPDWTPTGSSTLLDEIAFVRERYRWLTAEHLLDMVTTAPARIMGFSDLGRVDPGCLADLAVFGTAASPRSRAEAASVIVNSSVLALKLAIIGGIAVYGHSDLLERLPAPGDLATEPIAIAGDDSGVRRAVRFAPGDRPWEQMVSQLTAAMKQQGLPLAPLWEPNG
jgi:5-methylthioadenosine/S-adenosylhomocysteine deaminase